MPHDPPTPPPTDTPEPQAHRGAILEAVTAAPKQGLDVATALRVTTWILDEMADTFMLCAFANAVDACAEAASSLGDRMLRHPFEPGPGGSYDDAMALYFSEGGDPPDLRDDARRAAVRLYAAILRAPKGYDPAPALMRWVNTPGNEPPYHWREQYVGPNEAAARCWGHYAVMEALGHGVGWSDQNEPLMTPEPAVDLPSVGDLPGVSADDLTWTDEWTERADAARQARDARIAADRALEARNEERQEKAEAKRRARPEYE